MFDLNVHSSFDLREYLFHIIFLRGRESCKWSLPVQKIRGKPVKYLFYLKAF